MDVEDVMQPRVETCLPEAPLAEVRRRLARSPERCVVVVAGREAPSPLGAITPELVERTLRERGEAEERVPAWRALPPKLRSCWPTDSAEAAAAIMRAFGVRVLPVVDLERGLVGVVTGAHLVESGAVPREALSPLAVREGAELVEPA